MIFEVFSLQRTSKPKQAAIDDDQIDVVAEDNALMLPAIRLVKLVYADEIFFVDGDQGAIF